MQNEYELIGNIRKIEAAKTENLVHTSQLETNMNTYVNSP